MVGVAALEIAIAIVVAEDAVSSVVGKEKDEDLTSLQRVGEKRRPVARKRKYA